MLANNGILLQRITETVKNELKEQKGGFLSTLLSALGSSLLTSMVPGKGIKEKSNKDKGVIRAGEGTIIAGHGSKRPSLKNFLTPHSLTNFEIEAYYQNEPRFNGINSRDNLSENKRWDI